MVKQLAGAVMLMGLGVAAGVALSGSDSDQPPPPESADTVGITSAELAEIQRAWWSDIPEQATSDERNQADTIYVTEERVVQHVDTVVKRAEGETDTVVRYVAMPGRWFLDTLSAPQHPGDSARYAVTWIAGHRDGRVTRQDALIRHPSPPGPLKSVALDSAGLHADYGQWPGQSGGPSLLAEKLPMTAGCVTLGIYTGDAATALYCEAGSWGQVGAGRLIRAVF